MLRLIIYFVMGVLSDFVICRYTIYLTQKRTGAVVICNTLIFLMNIVFVGILVGQNPVSLLALWAGESAGIIMALELKFDKKVINREE
jgi:hypothetical protein